MVVKTALRDEAGWLEGRCWQIQAGHVSLLALGDGRNCRECYHSAIGDADISLQ